MGKKGVESMIEEIKVYIENCKPMPLSQTKISVQKPELLSMLDELELKLPGEIERCKKIMRNKEMILADARTRSDAIITESVNEANRMIEQNEITRLANIRADEILENARNQAQQIVDQASEEANEIRLGAMYYTKDKLTEMRDIFQKIHDMEKENYRVLIESLENDTYVIETNMTEMDTNINMFTASSTCLMRRRMILTAHSQMSQLQLQLRHHSQLQAIRRKPLRMRKSQKRTMTISTYTASVTRKRMTTMILMIS